MWLLPSRRDLRGYRLRDQSLRADRVDGVEIAHHPPDGTEGETETARKFLILTDDGEVFGPKTTEGFATEKAATVGIQQLCESDKFDEDACCVVEVQSIDDALELHSEESDE